MSSYKNKAFSSIELLITISILAILISLASPSLKQHVMQQEAKTSQLKLNKAIHLARHLAMTQASHIVICGSNNQQQCTPQSWQDGFLVFSDKNNNRNLDANEIIHLNEVLKLKYASLSWGSLNVNHLSFLPLRGLPLGSNGSFHYCTSQASFNYRLVVNSMGNTRIDYTPQCA